MNSSKEVKSATKGQKKLQKTNKKQQKQQQSTNGNKSVNVKSPMNPMAKPDETKTNNRNNNNNNMVKNNNSFSPTTLKTLPASTNITQKFKEHYEAERSLQSTKTSDELLPKMERTNSFRGKFSRFMNHLTGSKENLTRTDESKEEAGKTLFTFTRSRSMILLRRPNRRSFIEPQLEQLSEEAEKTGDPMSPTSPPKNSLTESDAVDSSSPLMRRRADTASSIKTPGRWQSAQPITSTPLDESVSSIQRKPSLVSLPSNVASHNPQLNFQKRRSNTLIASFKSTISGLTSSSAVSGSSSITSDKKKEKMNPKWSASLQSLQAIDNMVSYANMSFIDYDKFHGYEKQFERQQSLISLAEQQTPPFSQFPLAALRETSTSAAASLPLPHTPAVDSSSLDSTPKTVVLRRKRSNNSVVARPSSISSRNSNQTDYNLDTDYEHNLDKAHNVYRESLDSRTLELLNQRSRNSFIQGNPILYDALNLEDGSANRRCALCAKRVVRVSCFKQKQHQDVVEGRGAPKKQVIF